MRRLAYWSMFAAFQVVGFLLLWYGNTDTTPLLWTFAFVLLLPGGLILLLPLKFSGVFAEVSFLIIIGVNFFVWRWLRGKVGEELPF